MDNILKSYFINHKSIATIILFLVVFSLFPIIPPNKSSAAVSLGLTRPGNFLGLVGYWTFDGKDTNWTSATAGTTADKSGFGNTGTLTSMSQATSTAVGKIGQALKFNGSNENVKVADSTSMRVGGSGSSFSVSWWMKGSATQNSSGRILGTETTISTSQGWAITLGQTNQRVGVDLHDGTSSYVVTQIAVTAFTAGTWMHYMAVIDRADNLAKLYKSGALVNSISISGAGSFEKNYGLDMGCVESICTRAYIGSLDEVRVYNRALSESEIRQLYLQGESKFNVSPTAKLTNGLVGYWTFDGKDTNWTSGGAGTTKDVSGYGNTGTLTNMSQATTTAIGKIGQALNFDRVNDQINTGSDFIGVSPASITAWVKPVSIGESNLGTVLSNGNILFRFCSSNRIGITSNSSTFACSAINSLLFNTWTFISATRDASGVANLYINGVLSGTANQNSGTPANGTTNVFIGNNSSGSVTWDGLIDDVRVYNRVLTQSEIKQLYLMGN